MTQFSSIEAYDREAETERRIKHNRIIDGVVKLSLIDIVCNCGSRDVKQKRRGSYILKCNSCNKNFKLKNR